MSSDQRPVVALVSDSIYPYFRGGKELRYHEVAQRLAWRADVHVCTMKWQPGLSTWRDGQVTFRAVSGRHEMYLGERRMKAARVAVFPTAREGFGIAVLEAIACGVPVVTTSAPDNLARHLVARSATGVVRDPSAEAIAEAVRAVLETQVRGCSAYDNQARYRRRMTCQLTSAWLSARSMAPPESIGACTPSRHRRTWNSR